MRGWLMAALLVLALGSPAAVWGRCGQQMCHSMGCSCKVSGKCKCYGADLGLVLAGVLACGGLLVLDAREQRRRRIVGR